MLGIDSSVRIPLADLKLMANFGVRWVGRYYCPPDAPKRLVAAEVADVAEAGLYLLSVWEANPTYPAYFTEQNGVRDGVQARQQAQAAEQPNASVIHLAVDVGLTGNALQGISAYLSAFADAVAPYGAGIYGSGPVLQYASGPKVRSRWQTLAWSGGRLMGGADVYQVAESVTIAGVTVDLDWARTTSPLWVPLGMVPVPQDPDAALWQANYTQRVQQAVDAALRSVTL